MMSKKKDSVMTKYEARKMLEERGDLSRMDVRNLTGHHLERVKQECPQGKGMPKLKPGWLR